MKKITVLLLGLALSLVSFGQTDETDLIDFQINQMSELDQVIEFKENDETFFLIRTDDNDAILTINNKPNEYDFITFVIINKELKFISIGNLLQQQSLGVYSDGGNIFAIKIEIMSENTYEVIETTWLEEYEFADYVELANMGQALFDYYVGDKYKPAILK